MDTLYYIIDFVLHLNHHLSEIINYFGNWAYAVLFLVVFAETGLVITPFLPGDSLLFAAGALSALEGVTLNVHILVLVLFVAAVIGDTCNYWIGHYFGEKLFSKDAKILKQSYLDRTHNFYEKYGGKTIIIARFVPIIRTFAPFVAGAGSMTYSKFMFYNVIGAAIWVVSITYLGYYFGNIPIIKDNFAIVVIVIIILSIIPAIFEVVRIKLKSRKVK
jgi:membrane-associated protein